MFSKGSSGSHRRDSLVEIKESLNGDEFGVIVVRGGFHASGDYEMSRVI